MPLIALVPGRVVYVDSQGSRNRAVTPGGAAQWTRNHVMHSQRPELFTSDGARVLVATGTVTTADWWSWRFGPHPEGIHVLPPHLPDTASNELLLGDMSP